MDNITVEGLESDNITVERLELKHEVSHRSKNDKIDQCLSRRTRSLWD